MKTHFNDFIKENMGTHNDILDAIDNMTNGDLQDIVIELDNIMNADAPAKVKRSVKLDILLNLDSDDLDAGEIYAKNYSEINKYHVMQYVQEQIRYEVYKRFRNGVIK